MFIYTIINQLGLGSFLGWKERDKVFNVFNNAKETSASALSVGF